MATPDCRVMKAIINPRTNRGQFKPGTSGNPSGRPRGSRNQATLLAEQLLDGEAEQLIRRVINLAKKDNIHALRLCLERILPARKGRKIALEMPPARTVQDVVAGFRTIWSAVAEGHLTADEAHSFAEILNQQLRCFDALGVEERLQKLEERSQNIQTYERELKSFVQRMADEQK